MYQEGGVVKVLHIPQAFFLAHPAEWPGWLQDRSKHQDMLLKYQVWLQRGEPASQQASQPASPAAHPRLRPAPEPWEGAQQPAREQQWPPHPSRYVRLPD
jgi:hypothetical protein